MKGTAHRYVLGGLGLLVVLVLPACSGGIASNGRIAPAYQVPVLSQTSEGYREADAVLSEVATDLTFAANDAAWAIAAAPFRVLFGLTPFETGYNPAIVDHDPEQTSPETRRKRRRRALGLQPAAEDRVEARRTKRRRELERDQQRQN